MKKIFFIVCAAVTQFVSAQTLEKVNFVGALHRDASKDWTKGWTEWNPKNASYGTVTDTVTLNDVSSIKKISTTVTLDAKTVYLLRSMLVVESGAKLVIPAGTVIRGEANLAATPKNYATIVVERGGMIDIQGTNTKPVILTSNKAAGSRDRGDWGGLVICGKAVNNQGADVQLEGFNNVSVNNALGKFGGTDDKDNSGSIKYVRIEFAGLAFEPNKEVNSLTMGSVGSGTTIEGVQTSFGNDDAFEWFGGTVNCKKIVSYKTTDDDFDTDFGYRGTVQFGIAVRDTNYYDLSWNAPSGASTSETFESDNDAAGSGKTPYTSPIFSNITCVGPVQLDKTYNDLTATQKGAFRRGARIRRNSRLSIVNSIFIGYRNFIMFDGDSTLIAAGVKSSTISDKGNLFRNNYITNTAAAAAAGATNTGLAEVDSKNTPSGLDAWIKLSGNSNMVDKAKYSKGLILVDPQNATAPDFRPVSTNTDLIGSSDYSATLLANAGTYVVCDDFTTNPASITVKSGSDATFTVAFPDLDATYAWQISKGAAFVNTVDGANLTGSNNDTLNVKSVTMSNNGEMYRCLVSTRWCKDTSASAKLTTLFKACTLITTQPSNASQTIGSDAKFSVAVNDTAAKFAWHTDLDLGMQQLPTSNAKYVGANTKSLTVKSVALKNHQQSVKVIAFTNVCILDSCIAFKSVKVTDTLLVRFSVKVSSLDKGQLIKVYPNPAQNQLTIDNGNYTDFAGYTVNVYNSVGAVVYTQSINQQVYTIDLKSWSSVGVYRMELTDKSGAKIAVKTIVLN
ncbi:MAG: hypothetical protein RI977_1445 [Bacteroidota bacterium]